MLIHPSPAVEHRDPLISFSSAFEWINHKELDIGLVQCRTCCILLTLYQGQVMQLDHRDRCVCVWTTCAVMLREFHCPIKHSFLQECPKVTLLKLWSTARYWSTSNCYRSTERQLKSYPNQMWNCIHYSNVFVINFKKYYNIIQ